MHAQAHYPSMVSVLKTLNPSTHHVAGGVWEDTPRTVMEFFHAFHLDYCKYCPMLKQINKLIIFCGPTSHLIATGWSL